MLPNLLPTYFHATIRAILVVVRQFGGDLNYWLSIRITIFVSAGKIFVLPKLLPEDFGATIWAPIGKHFVFNWATIWKGFFVNFW